MTENSGTALTQSRVKELLRYDGETGIFIWIANGRGRKPAGRIAGCKRKNGYIAICVDQKFYQSHRLAWLYVHGEWPPVFIDHINGDPGDNRIVNLRLADRFQNSQNSKKAFKIYDLPKGVRWNKRNKNYTSSIKSGDKTYWLGAFSNPEAARAAYCAKAIELFGEYAEPSRPQYQIEGS